MNLGGRKVKVIAIIEKPENCLYCDMLNGSDECILQDEYQNLMRIL